MLQLEVLMKTAVSLMLLLAALMPLAALANPAAPVILRFSESDSTPRPAEEHDPTREWLLTQSTHFCYGDAWEPGDLEEYSYDQFNRLLQYSVKTWNDGAWLMIQLNDYFYNPEGLLAEYVRRNFDGYEWQKARKVCYEYDAHGWKTLVAVYDFYNNNWVEWYHRIYSYTPAGLLATENTYYVNGQGVTFETNLKTYSYNGAGQLTELFERSITGDWEFVFDHRTLYTYDQDGLLTQALYQEPDGNYIWQDQVCHLYYYDANNLMTEDCCQSYYSSTGWQNWYRRLFSYDANGLLIENHYQEYDGEWQSVTRHLTSRDDYGNDTERLVQRWIDASWNDTDKWERVFANTAGEDDLAPAAELNLFCGPNPFSQSVGISFELKYPARVELEVYNLRGQKLRALENGFHSPGKHELAWDGRDEAGAQVPPGIYLIRLQAGEQRTALRKISKY